MMDRAAVQAVVSSAIESFNGSHPDKPIDPRDDTVLYGPGSALDSLDLVALVVEIEDGLVRRLGLQGALSSERAFSERHSPFRTVRTLVDFVSSLEP